MSTLHLPSGATTVWRYLPKSKCRHAVVKDAIDPTGHGSRALCGLETDSAADWCGTGSQAEYDTAATLPNCTRCARKLAPRKLEVTPEHIRESNAIEGIHDPAANATSARAWRYLAARSALTRDVVRTTHWMVTEYQLGYAAGKLRTVNVQVGTHGCPPASLVPRLLDEWLHRMRRWQQLDPREQHVAFERIHPFVDGNGRTGRLLMWWHQIRLNQPPTLLRAVRRQDYYRWFTDPTLTERKDRQ